MIWCCPETLGLGVAGSSLVQPTAPTQGPTEKRQVSAPVHGFPTLTGASSSSVLRRPEPSAQTECRKDGGDLASIHNTEQHSLVMSQLGHEEADELWIGMNDIKMPQLFEWSDQSAVTFTRWDEAMPREGNCVLVRGEVRRKATQVDGRMVPEPGPRRAKQRLALCLPGPVPPTAPSQYPEECTQEEEEEEEFSFWNSPRFWLPFRGHCYSFVTNHAEWADASVFAEADPLCV
ncbi:macrophage mannose receptor 1-like [Salmo salar]|uniref:Macrophage mannose receptor 1-like n=1 Tax=Salmo salar TaxID=8030 RepID=A0ABM3EGU0_SALSA|nr:macrophage mannose receptor 1-like [Salmo salar]